MKIRLSLFLSFIILGFSVFGQSNPKKDFEKFAKIQDSLMVKAYEQKDIKIYQNTLDNFVVKYNKLDSTEQAFFSGYLNNAFYNFACTYSLLNNKTLALENLQKSIKAGYEDYMHIQEDSDLDNIRLEPKYVSLIQSLIKTYDYLYIIKKAGNYDLQDKRELPKFTYQDASNPNLVSLRKAFNLDSIAGKGNEVSKILSLMHWIHNLVPHDGTHGNPEVMNAMNMIAVCKKDNRGLNCRGLATVLNECYLSMGIKSRFITCLPKDSLGTDNDCHVINMVYCNSMKKWLWIDPTFEAYVMNEKGELLSIEEVRDRIINDKQLILNPEANWNHQESKTKEVYLYHYMAKNLYRLECLANSEYDSETRQQGKVIIYVNLLPLEYFKQKPDSSSQTNKKNGTIFERHNTNNPTLFWETK
jgi:hypothetical protein